MDKNIMFYYIAAVIIIGIGGTLLSKYFTNKSANNFLKENTKGNLIFFPVENNTICCIVSICEK